MGSTVGRTRPRFPLFALCLLSVLRGVASVGSAQEPTWPPANWTEAVEPFAVAEDLYYVGTAELGSFLFTSAAGHILLDVPLAENVDRVQQSIEKLGFSLRDVRILIISHAHFDHAGGLAEMKRRTGAEVVVLPASVELLESGGDTDFFLSPEDAAFPPVDVDRTLPPGGTLRVGPWELTAHWTPGHTRGCTSWEAEVKVAGERRSALVLCSLTVLPGYRLLGERPSYPGIARDFCDSVAHLESLPVEVFLANHASFFGAARKRDQGASAFVDPIRYRQFLERARHRIRSTLTEQAEQDGSSSPVAVETCGSPGSR